MDINHTKVYKRKYYLENRERYMKMALEKYYTNKDVKLKQIKEYQLDNKERIREYNKQYYHKNKPIVEVKDKKDKVKDKKDKIIESPTVELIEKVIIIEPMNVSFTIDW